MHLDQSRRFGVKDAFVSAGDPRWRPSGYRNHCDFHWRHSAKKQLQVKWNRVPHTTVGRIRRTREALVKRPQGENSIARWAMLMRRRKAAHTWPLPVSFVAHAPSSLRTPLRGCDDALEIGARLRIRIQGQQIARAFGPADESRLHQPGRRGFGMRLMTDTWARPGHRAPLQRLSSSRGDARR